MNARKSGALELFTADVYRQGSTDKDSRGAAPLICIINLDSGMISQVVCIKLCTLPMQLGEMLEVYQRDHELSEEKNRL